MHWQWGPVRVALVFGAFLLVDLAFVAGNATKIPHGGWVPLTIAAAMYFIFITWRDGRTTLRAELARRAVKLEELPKLLEGAARVPGTAVFLVSNAGYVPTALLRNLEHNHVCHEQVVMLNLEITRTPRYVGPARLGRNAAAQRLRGARALRIHGNAGCHGSPAQRAPARA